jgi:hypothetical protein
MTKQLIQTINQIAKFGLEQNIEISKDERNLLLERSLISIYSLYFEIQYEYDNTDFEEYDDIKYVNMRKNIESNFPDFGYYTIALDLMDINNKDNMAIGDAIDDLSDIILDLLQIKWRMENNSQNNGLWYFELIFPGHTQQHIIDLLKYLKQQK